MDKYQNWTPDLSEANVIGSSNLGKNDMEKMSSLTILEQN